MDWCEAECQFWHPLKAPETRKHRLPHGFVQGSRQNQLHRPAARPVRSPSSVWGGCTKLKTTPTATGTHPSDLSLCTDLEHRLCWGKVHVGVIW